MLVANILKEYLIDPNTTHAVLINGKWGSGKTFYWKNILSKNIVEKIPLPTRLNKQESYKSMYISLYGIVSIGELSRQILNHITIFPLENVLVKKLGELLEGASKKFTGIGGVSFTADEVCRMANKKIKEYVVVLDDIERVDSDVLISQILGYINVLAEHHGVKVVLLADVTRLTTKENVKWSQIKEKIVSLELKFSPDLLRTDFDVFKRYQNNREYYTYLKDKVEILNQLFIASGSDNLRSLFYSLDRVEYIFNLSGEVDIFKRRMDDIVCSVLAICFEFKSGLISNNNDFDIETFDEFLNEKRFPLLYSFNKENIAANKKESIEYQVIEKYYTGGAYFTLTNSLIDYCASGDTSVFSANELVTKLSAQISYITKEEVYLNQLMSLEFYDWEDEKLEMVVAELINAAKAKTINLQYYPALVFVFNYLIDKGLFEVNKVKLNAEIRTIVEEIVSDKNLKLETLIDLSLDSSDSYSNEITGLINKKQIDDSNENMRELVSERFLCIKNGGDNRLFDLSSAIDNEIIPVLEFLNLTELAEYLDTCLNNKFINQFRDYIDKRNMSPNEIGILRELYGQLTEIEFGQQKTNQKINHIVKNMFMESLKNKIEIKDFSNN